MEKIMYPFSFHNQKQVKTFLTLSEIVLCNA